MRQFVLQGLRFSVIGLLNTAIGLLVIYALMYFLGVGPFLANGIGYAIALTVSFFLNRSWTFGHSGAIQRAVPRYVLVVVLAYLANLGLIYYGIHYLVWDSYLAQVAGIIVYSSITFLGCRLFVFK